MPQRGKKGTRIVMATKNQPTNEQTPVAQSAEMLAAKQAEIENLKAQMDEMAKALATTKGEVKELKAAGRASTVKSLTEVIAKQENEGVILWMASTLVARVSQRVRAGQDVEEAIDQVFEPFAQFVRDEIAKRAKKAARSNESSEEE